MEICNPQGETKDKWMIILGKGDKLSVTYISGSIDLV